MDAKTVLILYLALVVAWPLIFVIGKSVGILIAKIATESTEKGRCKAMYDAANQIFGAGGIGMVAALVVSIADDNGAGFGVKWVVGIIIGAMLALVGFLVMVAYGDCDKRGDGG